MARRPSRPPARKPEPHPSGATAPSIPREFVPRHVALVMDGNGRWAKDRGLPRTAGHEAGEAGLFDCVEGALELGITWLSAYAFSTENWKRSPDEVRFLMGFNRDVIRRRRDEMNDMGVRVRWAGRRPRLWRSVINELETAEQLTDANTALTLTMCVNYGGRAEIADAAAALARDVRAGRVAAVAPARRVGFDVGDEFDVLRDERRFVGLQRRFEAQQFGLHAESGSPVRNDAQRAQDFGERSRQRRVRRELVEAQRAD